MLSTKRDRWKVRTALVGMLALLLLIGAVMLMSTDVQAQVSTLAVQSVPVVQSTPTEDATVTGLNKQKLLEDVEQQQHTLGNWLWSNAAALLSSLVLAIAGAFTLFRYLRDQRGEREKQREEHQAERERRDEEQKRWLKNQEAELEKRAEERFQAAVTGLGDEKEGAQIGAAILLRTFLRSGYEQFYVQTFDLVVANLRRRVSNLAQYTLRDAHQDPDISLPLTTLDQALIVVFKEAFPLARDQEKREPASLDATGVQLDNAYLVKADLKQVWGPRASLREAHLTEADLSGAHLTDANLSGANLTDANLSGAYLLAAILGGAHLSGANLREANLSGVYLREANLSGANLRGAFLGGAHLSGAYLTRANLSETNFSGADLSGAKLSRADLGGAFLFGTNLRGADLSGVNLRGAHLSGACLNGANLLGADLSEVSFFEAHFGGADLTRAEGLTKEQRAVYRVQGALVDEEPVSTADVSQSNGTSSQAAPDKGTSREAEKGDDVGRTP